MPLKFYYVSGSPFCWKIWLALEHKALDYELRILSSDAGDLNAPSFLSISPRGKVPVIDHEGFVLYESSAIVEYLEERFPRSGAPLWPEGLERKAYGRKLAAEADNYLYPPIRRLVEQLVLRRGATTNDAVVTEAKDLAADNLNMFVPDAMGGFLLGASPSAADFSVYPLTAILLRLDRLRPDLQLATILPHRLRTWRKRIKFLPYFDKTRPPHWQPSTT